MDIRNIVLKTAAVIALMTASHHHAKAQTADEDIWRQVELDEVKHQQSRNYCQRLYGYYRFIDDGVAYVKDRQHKLYRVYEGIYELDIRYSKDEDDGATVLAGRDLVHPDQSGKFIDFYELKPYTFLEKARKVPKHYTIKADGDTTRVFTRLGMAGIVVKDTLRRELHMHYDALAPDTTYTLNILIAKGRLSNVKADATYWYDETSEDYVPQGQLKRVFFDGHIDLSILGTREVFDEHTELYVDSVTYMTRDEYRADRKLSKETRQKRAGYTTADIDRLKQKLGVKPLPKEALQRIEDQRDWDEQFELWKNTQNANDKKQ